MDVASRELARQRAGRRCEYCHIHEDDEPYAFHLEHIVPKKHGGGDDPSNLAWSCHSCNLGKGANLAGLVQGKTVTLFHPRRQQWNRHFRWEEPFSLARPNAELPLFKSLTSMKTIALNFEIFSSLLERSAEELIQFVPST